MAIIDGANITDLHTDADGYTWHILQREGGSVCLYATLPHQTCHFVAFDTYDGKAPSATAQGVMAQLYETRGAIGLLLEATARLA